jgi:predicted transcriptional regulator of viral defense system
MYVLVQRDVLIRDLKASGIFVFRIGDVVRLTGLSRESVKVMLHRHVRDGWMWRVTRGVYSITSNPHVVATSLSRPSYLSFTTAYHIHGVVDQIPHTLTVATSRSRKALETEVGAISFVQVRPGLVFGFRKERYNDGEATIAELEKAIVDSVYLPRHAAFADTIEAVRGCDVDRLEAYAERSGIEVVRRRVGLLVNRLYGDTSIEPRGRTVYSLNPSGRARGTFDSAWRMYVNEKV